MEESDSHSAAVAKAVVEEEEGIFCQLVSALR